MRLGLRCYQSQMFGPKYRLKPDYPHKITFENGPIEANSFQNLKDRFSLKSVFESWVQRNFLFFILNTLSEVLKQFQFIYCTKNIAIAFKRCKVVIFCNLKKLIQK